MMLKRTEVAMKAHELKDKTPDQLKDQLTSEEGKLQPAFPAGDRPTENTARMRRSAVTLPV